MPHITVNKKQAMFDAEQLFNGDIDAALANDEPAIEEVQTIEDPDEKDPCDLHLTTCGETMCICPPVENQTSYGIANAIKRAGFHIWGLLQENELLQESVGKDLFAEKQKLLIALKQLRAEYSRVLRFIKMAARVDAVSPILDYTDAVISEVDAKERFDGRD